MMQREPSPQSLSYVQYFAPFTRSLGTLGLTSPEFISMPEQAPFRQLKPGLQSVSNTQARAGIEVRQRTPTMTRPRIVVPCEEPPKITPRNVQIWTAVAPVVIPSAWASPLAKSPADLAGRCSTRSSSKFRHLVCPSDYSFPSPRLLNSRFVKRGPSCTD